MKLKIKSIKANLLISIFTSAGLAGFFILLLCIVFIVASDYLPFAIFFMQHIFAFILMFVGIFVLLTIIFFLLIIDKKVNYLRDITSSLNKISHGNLAVNIPVKSHDQLGDMAKAVNSMTERLVMAIEEEQRLEREKSELITNMSHDLRTPLTSILGYLNLLNAADIKPEDSLAYISIALRKSEELKVMIDDLFDYNKLQQSDLILNLSDINIKQLVEQSLISFMPIMKDTGIKYRLHFTDEKLLISADPILIARVFDNLINNAVRHSKSDSNLDIKLSSDNGYTILQIINYGEEIPHHKIPYIFERFHKGDNKNSSGLGLAIVKRVVDLHSGTVNAESNGEKTTFTVKLPLMKAYPPK